MESFTQTSDLCLYCRKINFDDLIREDPHALEDGRFRFGTSYDLGSTQDLMQRSSACRLCHLFCSCLQEGPHRATALDDRGKTLKCELQEIPVAFLQSGSTHKSVYKLSFSVQEEADSQSIGGTESTENFIEFRFQAATRNLVSDLADLKPAPLRPRPLQCDFQLLKTWLRQCEKFHGPLCSLNGSYDAPGFRLVDVPNHCIIDASSLRTPSRYLTLSYVWGVGAQKWHLTAEVLEAAYSKRFFETVSLATTISDAMDLVCNIGERFLWVDSLCIIQDSEADKMQQIPHMGAIYEQALVTIVAASAEDANGGLPGVRLGTRNLQQRVLQTDEIMLTSALETELESMDGYDNFYWPTQSRKWTFQEGIFSRRCLFFSHEQVYWQCQSTKWSEEMLLQPTDESDFSGWTLWCLNRKHIDINMVAGGSMKDFADTYRCLVMAYSKRRSTYLADSLHAFQGLISVITRLTDVTFIWAIPQPGFDFYLLWDSFKSPGRGGLFDTTSFPSWSWIASQDETRPPDSTNVPELACYFLDYDGVCLESGNGPILRVHRDNKRVETQPRITLKDLVYPTREWKGANLTVTTNDILRLQVDAPLVGRFHLFFWTSLASLYVYCDDEETKLCLPIKKTGSSACAELITTKTSCDERTVELESWRQVGQWPSKDGPASAATPSLQDFIVVGSKLLHDGETLTTMMISWNDGIAKREYLTTIAEKDWMEADRTWRLIVLG